MKHLKFTILFFGLLFLSQSAMAQFGRMQQQGRRGMGAGIPNAGPSFQPRNEPKPMAEVITERMPFYIEALQLDDFEKEVFKQMLLENLEKRQAIMKAEEIQINDKRKMLEAMQKELTDNLSTILTEEELEKFKTLKPPNEQEVKKEKRKKKKKDKKSKKDKANKGTH